MHGSADNRASDLAALKDPEARAAFLSGLYAKYGPSARVQLAAGFRQILDFEDFMEQLHALSAEARDELMRAYRQDCPLDHLIRRALEPLIQKRVDLNFEDEILKRHYAGDD